jgi:hypothetical protein
MMNSKNDVEDDWWYDINKKKTIFGGKFFVFFYFLDKIYKKITNPNLTRN